MKAETATWIELLNGERRHCKTNLALQEVNKYSCSGPPAFKSGICKLKFS